MATEMMVPVDASSMPELVETVPDDIVLPGVQDEGLVVHGPDEVIETEPLTSTVDTAVVVHGLVHFDHTPSGSDGGPLADGVLTPRPHVRLAEDDLDEDEEISNDEDDDMFMSSSDDEPQDVIVDDGTQIDDEDYIVDEEDVYDDDDYIEEDESGIFKPRRRIHGRRISSSLKRKPQGMYKCSECYKAFALFENLQKHSRLHTAESPFACQICRKPFTKPSALERHMRTHTGERPYNCDSCGKGFTRRSHLQRHVKLHYSNKPFRCSECRSAFTSEEALYEHKMIHMSQTPNNPQQRGSQAAPSMEFLAQAAMLAGAELLNGQPAEGNRSQLAYNARQMEVLMTQQTREQAAEASGGVMLAEGKYKCRKCAKTFAKLGSLEKHAILHTDQSPFKCQYCHRGFPKPSILKRHMGVHLREQDVAVRRKPHSYMSATSRRRQGRHIEEEELEQEGYNEQMGDVWEGGAGKKKYKCEHCWQSFVFEDNLERHQLRHTEASPYKCAICNRPFTKQSKLLRHEKTHQMAQTVGDGGVGSSVDLLQEEYAEVPKDINDDVQAILAASTKGKGRQSRKKGHRHRRSGIGTGSSHRSRRGKKRKVLVARAAEKRSAKRHKGHMTMAEADIDSLPGHQITPVDTNEKSPVGALHITSVDSVEVPLPSAAPPEQLMDSPPPRAEEEVVLEGEEVVETPVETEDIGAGGEMVIRHGEVVVEGEDIEETSVENGVEMLVVTTVSDDLLDTDDHIAFSAEFTPVSDEHAGVSDNSLVTVTPVESESGVPSDFASTGMETKDQ